MNILAHFLRFLIALTCLCSPFMTWADNPDNMIFGPTAYDSGWIDVTQEMTTFEHNLGGDVEDYVVDMQFRDTQAPGGFGVNSLYAGVDTRGDSEDFVGAEIYQISPTRVYVATGPDDTSIGQIRIRIWRVPDPAYDSGWYSIEPNHVHSFVHLVGGDPDDYVVDLSLRTSGGVIHKRSLGMDQYGGSDWHEKGAAWRSLDDTQIWVKRGAEDVDAYEVRVRIFVPPPPSWSTGWKNISAPMSSTYRHGLGGPWNDFFVILDHKDPDNGMGVNSFYSGTDLRYNSGSERGAAWLNLTGDSIKILRAADDIYADQIRVRIWASRAPKYDSGWKALALDDALMLHHRIGGTSDAYVVDLQMEDSNATINAGINAYKYGVDQMYNSSTSSWDVRGAAWYSLDSAQITVYRAPADLSADRIRVRIWEAPEADADSGWQIIEAGTTNQFVHNLGGSTLDYVVDLQCRSADAGVNQIYFGGDKFVNPNSWAIESKGAYWRDLRLDDVTIHRNPEDTSCEEYRIRIWKDPPFDWQSPMTAISPGSQYFNHNLGVPPEQIVVSMGINSDNSSFTNHVYQFGGDRTYFGREYSYGAWWQNLESDSIRVFRAADDIESDSTRMRLWWTGPPDPMFADDFESGDTSVWSSTVP